MVTFWERASCSVDDMFSLYFDYLSYELFLVLVLSAGFGKELLAWLTICVIFVF